MMISKNFKGVLVINWKTGSLRVTKKAPKRSTPFEIPIRIDFTINIPENPDIVARGEVTLSEKKVSEMTIEAL